MHELMFINNGKFRNRNTAYLDHPDLIKYTKHCDGTLKAGDFGPARPEIVQASGITNYNCLVENVLEKSPAVVHSNGSEIYLWARISRKDVKNFSP